MPAAKRRHENASDRRDTPPVDVFSVSRQVSWLAGRRRALVFPMRMTRVSDVKSGETRCLQLRGQRRNFAHKAQYTGFPLSHQILQSGGP